MDGNAFVQALSGVADNALAAQKNEAIAKFSYYATRIVQQTGVTDQEQINRMHRGISAIVSGYGRTPDLDDLAPVGSEAEKTILAFADYAHQIMDSWHQFMKEAAPDIDIGYLKGYIPMSMTGEMRDFLIKLASSPAYLTYEAAAGAGEKAAGTFFLGRVIDSMTKGGRVEAAIGTNRHLMKRETTISPVVSLHDASIVQLFNPAILQADGLPELVRGVVRSVDGDARLSIHRINDYMEGVIKDLVQNFDLKIKTPKKGLRVYNEDVFVTMSKRSCTATC
jgi:hypothetical protein